jgi:Zn-dependent protease with chaperone function
MSALTKLSGKAAQGDLRGGAAVEVLGIVGAPRASLFADHPPLEKRLAALEEMARKLGNPVK